MRQFHLWTIGCQMNKAESWHIARLLAAAGYAESPRLDGADLVVLNTCVVRQSAEDRIVGTLGLLEGIKRRRPEVRIAVTGCFAARDGSALRAEYPHVDLFFGSGDYTALSRWLGAAEAADSAQAAPAPLCGSRDSAPAIACDEEDVSDVSAYVPIIQGCNNFCTYCIIPKIRGKYRSRQFESIISEAEKLAENGVKELILVAQDTTRYGIDLYGRKRLHELLQAVAEIEGLKWVRVLYCYPEEIYDELIDTMASNPKICRYLDIPLQHISDRVLKMMGRRGRKAEITRTINKIREKMSDVCLRTSIIVGFPGETEDDFKELCDFVSEVRFDNLGVFMYSQEEDTPAAIMNDQVDEETKLRRHNELMALQQNISKEKNSGRVGRIYDVIIEGQKNRKWYGRSCEMAPDIDGLVYIESKYNLEIGSIIKVKITGSKEYDLLGVIYYESR